MSNLKVSDDLDIAPTKLDEVSRMAIMSQMEKMGINANALSSLTIAQLSDLLYGMNKLAVSQKQSTSSADKDTRSSISLLSSVDKKLLNELITSQGDVSMVAFSRSLQVPLTTLQRRRKRIEDLLVRTYSLNYEKFGMKQITFLVSTEGHSNISTGKQALSLTGVTRTVRTLSNAVDLQVHAVVKTNKEIADLAEQIKAIKGVRSITWFESIGVIGEKKDTDLSIIDSA